MLTVLYFFSLYDLFFGKIMKPNHLSVPFVWNQRRVLIEDRIFYVPPRCEGPQDFIFPGWNHPTLFGNANPIKIEYCSGNGFWVAEKAKENPLVNWIAVEKKFVRVRKIWSKIKNMGLNNLVVICGEACHATQLYIPGESCSAAYINFPDPWPKTRHAKNRLIRPQFVEEVWRILQPKTSFTLVTDDPDYSVRMIAEMTKYPGFTPSYPAPYYLTEMPGYGTSSFEQLWLGKGKTIRFHQFCKK